MSQFQSSVEPSSADSREGPSLLTVGPNLKGTDYFVGDLHGDGRLLYAALKHLGFDWSVDRLFAVGDLVDRGYSHAQLFKMIIGQPNFYSVLGNHDVDCWTQIQTYFNDGQWLRFPESEWLQECQMGELSAIRNFIRELPLAIQVTLSNGLRVGIVHADLPDDLTLFAELANISREYLPTITPKSPINALLLGRRRPRIASNLFMDKVFGGPGLVRPSAHRLLDVGNDLDLIICGHSVSWSFRPFQVGKWIFLDTGVGNLQFEMQDAALTVLDPVARRVVQARHAEYGTVSTSEFVLDDAVPIPAASMSGGSDAT